MNEIKVKKKFKKLNKKNLCLCGNFKNQFKSKTCRQCYLKLIKETRVAYTKSNNTCNCGEYKSKTTINCNACYLKIKRDKVLNKTIEYYWKMNRGSPNAYVHIRTNARKLMNESGIDKQCKNCKYNIHVEVCHIKSIKDFNKLTTLKEVNDLTNLIYLCPNCHWEFDKGKLTIEIINSKIGTGSLVV